MTIAHYPSLPQPQQQLQKSTSTAQQLLHLQPIPQPFSAPLSPKPIPASVLRMLLPSDNPSWLAPESHWYSKCSIYPSVQHVKLTPGPYAQQHAPHLQTDSSPHPNLVPLIPPMHAEDSHQLLPCPQKPSSSALNFLPAFGCLN